MAHRIKLERPDRDRIRVRDLATLLRLAPAALLEHIRARGEYVPSIHSFIESPLVRAVRADFNVIEVEPTRDIRPWGPETPAHGVGLDAPPRPPRRENGPFRTVVSEVPADRETRDGRAAFTSQRQQPPDYTAALAFEASDVMKDLEWSVRGFTEVERDVWLAEGLSDRQAKYAADCRDANLTPADLGFDVYGSSVLFRITHGENAGQVARLLHRAKSAG